MCDPWMTSCIIFSFIWWLLNLDCNWISIQHIVLRFLDPSPRLAASVNQTVAEVPEAFVGEAVEASSIRWLPVSFLPRTMSFPATPSRQTPLTSQKLICKVTRYIAKKVLFNRLNRLFLIRSLWDTCCVLENRKLILPNRLYELFARTSNKKSIYHSCFTCMINNLFNNSFLPSASERGSSGIWCRLVGHLLQILHLERWTLRTRVSFGHQPLDAGKSGVAQHKLFLYNCIWHDIG